MDLEPLAMDSREELVSWPQRTNVAFIRCRQVDLSTKTRLQLPERSESGHQQESGVWPEVVQTQQGISRTLFA